MEFLSRSDDKKLRWIITESCPHPHLIDEKQVPDQDEEVKGEGEVKGDDEIKSEEDTPPKGNDKRTKQKEADSESIGDEATVEVMEEEKPGSAKPAGRGGWRGRRGRGRGDRGAILLTSLEQEMLLWALGGFLPIGPEGLKPSPEHQVSVEMQLHIQYRI